MWRLDLGMPRYNRRGTLHRLLQLCPGSETVYNRDNRFDADLVVVDEASMLDVLLANTLVTIPPGAHLLFVGDVHQLPSGGAGAGEVLRDVDELPSPTIWACWACRA